jgi:hypothetical protein
VSQSVSQSVSLAGLALVLYSIFAFDKNTPSPSLYTLIPTIGAGLILIFSNNGNLVGKLLGSKLAVGIGLISYSAYLWHQPLFAFTRYESLNEENKILLGLMALASILLAFISWKYIEKPFRDNRIIKRGKIFTLAILGSSAFITIGYIGHKNGGYEFRLPIESRDSNLFGNSKTFSGSRTSDNSCLDYLKLSLLPEEVCLASSKEPDILFAGDSHAMALYSSIYGNNIGHNGVLISGHSCPMYPALTYTPSYKNNFGNNCTNIANEAIRVAKKFDSIKTVVVVNYYNNVDENLCLLCPNCHSQTSTYKARNRGNGRHFRMQRFREGKSY